MKLFQPQPKKRLVQTFEKVERSQWTPDNAIELKRLLKRPIMATVLQLLKDEIPIKREDGIDVNQQFGRVEGYTQFYAKLMELADYEPEKELVGETYEEENIEQLAGM